MTLVLRVRRNRGFALPTILILTVILLMILLGAIGAMSTVRQSLVTQQYTRLAQLAAESGVNYAVDCLSGAEMLPEAVWKSDTAKITPVTSCSGEVLPDNSNYVMEDMEANRLRTTFVVDKPKVKDGAMVMTSTGYVEILRASDTKPWKTYTYYANVKIGTDLGKVDVYFGYSTNGGGGFFTTVSPDGLMLATGANSFGQLGNGTQTSTLTPTAFRVYGQKPVKAFANIVSQGFALFALTDVGDLWGAGLNTGGQLGNASVTTDYVTTPIRYQVPAGEKIKDVLNIASATFVVTDAGHVYAAGTCLSGQLGIGACTSGAVYRTPQKVLGLPPPNTANDATIPAEMFGDYRGVILRMKGGQVYGWGYNRYGEMATGNKNIQDSAVRIGSFGDPAQPKAVQVQFDGDTTYILDSNGDVWCSGYNGFGELGISASTGSRTTLAKIPNLPTKITKVATDQWSVAMVGVDGNVYSLGLNNSGQLGNGEIGTSSQAYSTPQKFLLPAGVIAKDVVTASLGNGTKNYNNTFVLTSDGQVYGAGSNMFGQIGLGTSDTSFVTDPGNNGHMIVFDGVVVKASRIYTGYGETIIIATNGRVYTVGNNQSGQLGDGTTNNDSTPRARQYVNAYPPRMYF